MCDIEKEKKMNQKIIFLVSSSDCLLCLIYMSNVSDFVFKYFFLIMITLIQIGCVSKKKNVSVSEREEWNRKI